MKWDLEAWIDFNLNAKRIYSLTFMKVTGLAWMGIRTEKYDESIRFFKQVMQLKIKYEEKGFTVFSMPDGDTVEVFSSKSSYNTHFGSSPVVGFLVDDIEKARQEIVKSGLELVGKVERDEHGGAWQHFRGPDGNLYELTYNPEGAVKTV